MKREDLFLTREQCLHLQELGLDMSDANYAWVKWADTIDNAEDSYSVEKIEFPKNITIKCITEKIPTYTLQEILETLPKVIEAKDCENNDSYFYLNLEDMTYRDFAEISIDDDIERGCTMKESAYNLLVWCLENNYL